jgi:hypothetical protein
VIKRVVAVAGDVVDLGPDAVFERASTARQLVRRCQQPWAATLPCAVGAVRRPRAKWAMTAASTSDHLELSARLVSRHRRGQSALPTGSPEPLGIGRFGGRRHRG